MSTEVEDFEITLATDWEFNPSKFSPTKTVSTSEPITIVSKETSESIAS